MSQEKGDNRNLRLALEVEAFPDKTSKASKQNVKYATCPHIPITD
jgi:hypothetical protein